MADAVVKDEDLDLMGDGSEILDAQAEIDAIQGELEEKEVQKPVKRSKKAKKERDWRDKYRGKQYFRRFRAFLAGKWSVSRSNWLNLQGFAAIFTNLLSISTVILMVFAMYYSVDHLRKGSDFTLILAGAVLIGVIGWINTRIGNGQDAQDVNQS